MVTYLVDPADDRLADYRALTDVELRTRWEPPNGVFIAEGELVLRRAIGAGYPPRSFLVDAKRVDQVGDLHHLAPVYAAEPSVLRAITGFNVHRGLLASFHRKAPRTAADVMTNATRLAVLENINNHTNIGAIFRGAAALGMDAVLLSPTCADPLYRRSVRVSMGEVFAVPYATLGPPWPRALATLATHGFTLLALTPAADAVPVQGLTPAQRERPALLLGAEGSGLSAAAMAAADARVTIPMRNGVDSLNVAAAAAVAFWELCRDLPP
jgi:tRNA G18 (ribose-2'-O)-methylase SpoU